MGDTLASAFLLPAGGIRITVFSHISRGTNIAQIGFLVLPCMTVSAVGYLRAFELIIGEDST